MLYLLLLFIQLGVVYLLSKRLSKLIFWLISKLTHNRKTSSYIYAFIFAPGTFVHEFAHFLAALFLLVPVGNLNLLPKIEDEQIRMGSVSIAKTDPFRRLLIGVSPFFVGVIILLTSVYLLLELNLLQTLWAVALVCYISFEVSNTMFASKKDLQGAWVVAIFFLALYFGLQIMNFDISPHLGELLSDKFLDVLININLFLLVPVLVDITVIIALSAIREFTK